MFQIVYSKKVWDPIQGTFILNNAEEVEPDPEELEAIRAYKSGDPEYQPYIYHEEWMKELGL